MIVWNASKNRVLYREDKYGKRTYPFGDGPEGDHDEIKRTESPIVEEASRAELVEIAKKAGVKGAVRMKKNEILEALE